MAPHWIDPPLWKTIQATVPIVCADILPLTRDPSSRVTRVGLIWRDTPAGRRWGLVGGRICRDESLAEAVARQIRETLGPAAEFTVPADLQPLWIAQYFTTPRPEILQSFVDPRQHAIGLIFALEIAGTLTPQGEALDFRWFPPAALPPHEDFGFDQWRAVEGVLHRLII